jgi:hypothetical protein
VACLSPGIEQNPRFKEHLFVFPGPGAGGQSTIKNKPQASYYSSSCFTVPPQLQLQLQLSLHQTPAPAPDPTLVRRVHYNYIIHFHVNIILELKEIDVTAIYDT